MRPGEEWLASDLDRYREEAILVLEKGSAGPRYVTVVRFDEEKDNLLDEAWSLVLDFCEPPDESLRMTADVRFLVQEAPLHLFHSGSTFELLEGAKVVAKGKVLLTGGPKSGTLTLRWPGRTRSQKQRQRRKWILVKDCQDFGRKRA